MGGKPVSLVPVAARRGLGRGGRAFVARRGSPPVHRKDAVCQLQVRRILAQELLA